MKNEFKESMGKIAFCEAGIVNGIQQVGLANSVISNDKIKLFRKINGFKPVIFKVGKLNLLNIERIIRHFVKIHSNW